VAEDNSLEMEVRLRDFVSGELKKVHGSVVKFGQEGKKAFADLSAQVKTSENSFGSMFKMLGAYVSAQTILKFAGDAIKAFQEQEQANIKLEHRLMATGHASGFVADELKEMASALQLTTKFSDDTIQNAQTMLLTFDNIGRDIFPQVLDSAMGLSIALGTDLSSAATQVGIALQKPEDAGKKLKAMNIILSESQKAIIENFVKEGKTAEAQAVVLGHITKLYGGLAEASVTAEQIMANKWEEFKEGVGSTLTMLLRETIGLFVDLEKLASKKTVTESLEKQQEAVGNQIEKLVAMKEAGQELTEGNAALMTSMNMGRVVVQSTDKDIASLTIKYDELGEKIVLANAAKKAGDDKAKENKANDAKTALALALEEQAKQREIIKKNQEEITTAQEEKYKTRNEEFVYMQQLREAEVQADKADADKKIATDKAVKAQLLETSKNQMATTQENLKTLAGKYKAFGAAYKAVAFAQNMMDTYAGATAAFKSFAGLGPVGVALGFASAGIAVAAGIARGAQINAQEFETGGFPSGSSVLVRVNERGQEAILNASATSRLGEKTINDLNSGKNPLAGNKYEVHSPISFVINGNVDRGVMEEIGMSVDKKLQALAKDIAEINYRRIRA
jgi:uncharacterized protein YoaH (UPF0181 family)